jgi:hypothetical protein
MLRKILVAGALALATMLIPMTAVAQGMRTFTVFNYSHYRIDHMYVSPSGYSYWGNDRLGRDVLLPNYRFDLSVVRGWYDVKVVDQDGDSCIVPNIDFRSGESWTITDNVLLACETLSQN